MPQASNFDRKVTNELAELCREIRTMALAAGEMLLEGMEQVHTVDAKSGTEFVTEMDRKVEDYLLEQIGGKFAGDTIAAEETGWKDGTSDRIWYVDPLDGTTNYAHGYPIFGVSIACAQRGELIAGSVFAPYLDELYLAAQGAGATQERTREGRIVDLNQRESVPLQAALLATGFPYERNHVVDLNTGLTAAFLKAKCHGVRRGGSAAVDLSHVAAGKLDGYWEFKLRPWDTAAGTLIARETGVLVSDFEGEQKSLHTQTILAAVPELHGEMLRILAAQKTQKDSWDALSSQGGSQ